MINYAGLNDENKPVRTGSHCTVVLSADLVPLRILPGA